MDDYGPFLNPSPASADRMAAVLRMGKSPFTHHQDLRIELLQKYPPADGLNLDELGHQWWLPREKSDAELRANAVDLDMGNPLVTRQPGTAGDFRAAGVRYVVTNSEARDQYFKGRRGPGFPSFVRFYQSLERGTRRIKTFDPRDWDGKGPVIWIYDLAQPAPSGQPPIRIEGRVVSVQTEEEAGDCSPPDRAAAAHRGRGVSPLGKEASQLGKGVSPLGNGVSPPGRGLSPPGKGVSQLGRGVSRLGKGVSRVGKGVSPLLREIERPILVRRRGEEVETAPGYRGSLSKGALPGVVPPDLEAAGAPSQVGADRPSLGEVEDPGPPSLLERPGFARHDQPVRGLHPLEGDGRREPREVRERGAGPHAGRAGQERGPGLPAVRGVLLAQTVLLLEERPVAARWASPRAWTS